MKYEYYQQAATYNQEREKVLYPWVVFFLAFILLVSVVASKALLTSSNNLISPLQYITKEEQIKDQLQKVPNTYVLPNKSVPNPIQNADFNNASSFIVTNFDNGQVVTGKNIDTKLPIASITKVMTAVVALDLADPDETFTVSSYATRIQPTKIGVVRGEKMTVSELIHAMLLTSANDAAQVIKEGIDAKYGTGTFVKAMNQKAQFLGLSNSRFSNPQGFDSPNNYSSVSDLAILSHYALTNYSLIDQVARKDYAFLPANKNHKQFDLYNWNGLLGVYPGVYGLKIGNTDAAGTTTIVVSQRGDKKMVAVILGAPGVLERDMWASQLLDVGFGHYGMKAIAVNQ